MMRSSRRRVPRKSIDRGSSSQNIPTDPIVRRLIALVDLHREPNLSSLRRKFNSNLYNEVLSCQSWFIKVEQRSWINRVS
jgi:hypothetical protein